MIDLQKLYLDKFSVFNATPLKYYQTLLFFPSGTGSRGSNQAEYYLNISTEQKVTPLITETRVISINIVLTFEIFKNNLEKILKPDYCIIFKF